MEIRPRAEIIDILSPDLGSNPSAWDEAIFRGTHYGLGLVIATESKIQLNGIVEGTEIEAATELSWPFTREEFWIEVEGLQDTLQDCYIEGGWAEAEREDDSI